MASAVGSGIGGLFKLMFFLALVLFLGFIFLNIVGGDTNIMEISSVKPDGNTHADLKHGTDVMNVVRTCNKNPEYLYNWSTDRYACLTETEDGKIAVHIFEKIRNTTTGTYFLKEITGWLADNKMQIIHQLENTGYFGGEWLEWIK